jgi:hypothetical protein
MSHQDRRLPLPADYQFPTHGVDCDCPPCREKVIVMAYIEFGKPIFERMLNTATTQTAYGWGV